MTFEVGTALIHFEGPILAAPIFPTRSLCFYYRLAYSRNEFRAVYEYVTRSARWNERVLLSDLCQ